MNTSSLTALDSDFNILKSNRFKYAFSKYFEDLLYIQEVMGSSNFPIEIKY